MAKKQTRRSVSIRGETYATVRGYCEQHGVSMSEFVEQQIAQFFRGAPISVPPTPRVTVAKRPASAIRVARSKRSLDNSQLQDAARYFTF